jgi:hypothetical protein
MKQYTMLLVGKMFFPLSKPLQLILFKKKHTPTQDVSSMLQYKKMPIFFPYWKAPSNYGSWGRGQVTIMGTIIIDHQHLE